MLFIMFAFVLIMFVFIIDMCIAGIVVLLCIIAAAIPGLDAIPVLLPMSRPIDGRGECVMKGVVVVVVVVGKQQGLLLLKLWLWL